MAALNHHNSDLFAATLQEERDADLLTPEQVQSLQLRRLRLVVARAMEFVPLYRVKYAAHRDWLHTLTRPDDLWSLPSSSKEDLLRAAPFGHVDDREEPALLSRRTTSGSLGPALSFYASPTETMIHTALLWTGWMGRVSPSDR